MDPSADWSNTTKLYEKIASITGGEADFVPVWTSRLLDYYPHNQGYVVARFEYPRFQPRYKGGILVVDSKGHPAKQKSFPSIDLAPISIMSRTATPQIVFELKPLKDIKTTSAREAADKQMRDRLREIFRLYHLPIWRELKKEGGEETTPSAQFDTPYVPNLDGPIESDEVDDSDRIDEPKLSVEKPLKTLYGISAFGNNFAVYRLKIDSKFNPELFDKNSLILPRPGQQSNNTYATLQNRCPESWWAYDATTIEGKQVLDDVIALSQEAFLALTLPRTSPTHSKSGSSSSLSDHPSEQSAGTSIPDSLLPRTLSLFDRVPYLVTSEEAMSISSSRGEVSSDSAPHSDPMDIDSQASDPDYEPDE